MGILCHILSPRGARTPRLFFFRLLLSRRRHSPLEKKDTRKYKMVILTFGFTHDDSIYIGWSHEPEETVSLIAECAVGAGVSAVSGIPWRGNTVETKKLVIPCPSEQEELRDAAHVPGSQPCIVCHDNQVRCVLSPCGHAQLCVKCARTVCKTFELRQCPTCRMPIERAIILFQH